MKQIKSVEQMLLPYKNKRLSPLKAIKIYCKLYCCVNDRQSWVNCSIPYCPLFRYRLGIGNRSKKQKPISTQHNSNKNSILQQTLIKQNKEALE